MVAHALQGAGVHIRTPATQQNARRERAACAKPVAASKKVRGERYYLWYFSQISRELPLPLQCEAMNDIKVPSTQERRAIGAGTSLFSGRSVTVQSARRTRRERQGVARCSMTTELVADILSPVPGLVAGTLVNSLVYLLGEYT